LIKLSIVTAVLDSPEIVKRQLLHYNKMNLPDNVEIVYVDDGSEPPLVKEITVNFNFRILATNDHRYWTQPAARNFGVKNAKGDYVLCLDVDHILPKKTIDLVLTTDYDIVRFRRQVGVLDENGDFTQDMGIMREWGLSPGRGLKLPAHSNSFAMRRGLYLALGGVSEQHVGTGKYPNREELPLKRAIVQLGDSVKILQDKTKPMIYMFPNGQYCGDKDYNPFGFFHDMTRSIRTSRKRQREHAGA